MWVVLLQLKPGLSYYAKDPQATANSLTSLLDKAESVVPLDLQSKTAVRVGATAGLRALGGEAFDKILQSVRELLKSRSTLKSEANGVKILDGSQEGSYEWLYTYGFLVYSYLHYGLLAARAEILKATEDSGNPCILEGFDGMFEFLWLQPTL
ncbi:hypothetical protein CXB51_019486 [Gossypium anomalum]|uniref:apyrase n=1 Tax=Gossypium anomalum TaxID=47600 RepID=A0A8J6CXV1_9ROSI|nr:hypothetical protein CXB51_019486 [Gossypium anomalum]